MIMKAKVVTCQAAITSTLQRKTPLNLVSGQVQKGRTQQKRAETRYGNNKSIYPLYNTIYLGECGYEINFQYELG
jgi:hypothetical protein